MSPERSVTYVSGPDPLSFARPEGFEPPTLCLEELGSEIPNALSPLLTGLF